MHVSTKDVVTDPKQAKELEVPTGTHILTNTIEADGALEIVTRVGKIEAKVISVQRTDSGGVRVQTAVFINEPKPQAPVVVTAEDQALAYLGSKGITGDEAKQDLAKFGAARILAAKSKAEAEQEASLDEQLSKKLS